MRTSACCGKVVYLRVFIFFYFFIFLFYFSFVLSFLLNLFLDFGILTMPQYKYSSSFTSNPIMPLFLSFVCVHETK